MAANCYWCTQAEPERESTPLGCCKRCQVFACNEHASYDNVILEYVCSTCTAAALTGSALTISISHSRDEKLSRFNNTFADFGRGGLLSKFKGLMEFQSRMPGYSAYFQLIDESNERPSWDDAEIDRELHDAGETAKGLYLAAAVLMAKLPFPTITDPNGESAFPEFLFGLRGKIVDQIQGEK